jgi:hypothetical protein
MFTMLIAVALNASAPANPGHVGTVIQAHNVTIVGDAPAMGWACTSARELTQGSGTFRDCAMRPVNGGSR